MKKKMLSAATAVLGEDKQRKRGKVLRIFAACLLAAFLFAAICVDSFIFPLEYFWTFAYQPSLAARQEGEMRVHFLDVGQGDCTVVEFPDGKSMVIDGGNAREETRMRVIGYCRALGILKFDVAVLTHSDSDHAGGFDDILRCFGADLVYVPAMTAEEEGVFSECLDAARGAGAQLRLSQMFETGVSASEETFYYWMMLSPDSALSAADGNDRSAVLYMEYAGRTLLFMGDVSAAVEDRLADAYAVTEGVAFEWTADTAFGDVRMSPCLEELDFLKAGHHGSGGSTGKALAELCRPRNLFISCGAGNTYGHPGLVSIGNILSASPGADIYRTDELGNIMLTIRSDGTYFVEYAAE